MHLNLLGIHSIRSVTTFYVGIFSFFLSISLTADGPQRARLPILSTATFGILPVATKDFPFSPRSWLNGLLL